MLRNELFKPWFVEDKWGVEVISGQFKDVVLQFNSVEFSESEEGNIQLDYHTINLPDNLSDEDLKTEQFNKCVSRIINDILIEAIKDEQNRTNNSSESSK